MRSLFTKISKKKSPLVYGSIVSSLDQSLLSGTNFIIAFALIKLLPKEEFGLYSIALPIIYFMISVQNALVNTPLAVLLPSREKDKHYVSSLWYGLIITSVPLAAAAFILILCLKHVGLLGSTIAAISLAVCASSVGILLKEYLRAFFFAERNPEKVLRLDVVYALLFLGMVFTSAGFFKISIQAVFALMGVASLLVAGYFSRARNWEIHVPAIVPSFRQNWKIGKWASLGVIVSHMQSYSYVYLLGGLLGSAAVADAAASRLLLMPIVLFQTGWCKVSVPYGAKLDFENKRSDFFYKSISVSIILLVSISVYVFLLQNASGLLETFFFSEKYQRVFDYVWLWGCIFCIRSFVVNASAGLQSIQEFRLLSLLNACTMAITLISSYFLITSFGIVGAFTAQIIGETFLAISLWSTWAIKTLGNRQENTPALDEYPGKNIYEKC